MAQRKSNPTPVGDVIEGGESHVLVCDECSGEVEWAGRLALAETLREQQIPILCESCLEAQDREGEAEEAREQQRRYVEALMRRSGMPAKWREQDFDSIEADEPRAAAISAAAEWALGVRRRGLLFHGPVGRGKTAIAAAAAVGRIRRGAALRWLSVAELLMDLRMPFESAEYVRAQRALDPRGAALVLDDLDKVRPSEFAREPVYVAINAWVEAELPLLVTMNRTLDDLEDDFGERYGPAVASRLAGYCDLIEVGGRDRRIA